MNLQSFADRSEKYVDSRDIVLNAHLFNLKFEEISDLLRIALNHLVSPFLDNCVMDFVHEGKPASPERIRMEFLADLNKDKSKYKYHYSSIGYDMDVKSAIVRNKTSLRNLKYTNRWGTDDTRYSDSSIDHQAYLNSLFGNNSTSVFGNQEMRKLLNENRIFIGTPMHHDARLYLSCHQYRYIPGYYVMDILFNIGTYVCQHSISEMSEVLIQYLLNSAEVCDRINATISLSNRWSRFGCSHYDYFYDKDQSIRQEGEYRYDPIEWMRKDHLVGAEWVNLISKHVLEASGTSGSSFIPTGAGYLATTVNGSTIINLKNIITDTKTSDIQAIRRVLRPLLLPGKRINMPVHELRKRWEIIIIEDDEFYLHDGKVNLGIHQQQERD